MVGGQGKEESSAADAPHLHYDLATATAEHEHGSDESRSAGHRRSSDGREQGRVIGRAHGPLGKTLACPLKVVLETYHEGSDRCDGGPLLTSENVRNATIPRR